MKTSFTKYILTIPERMEKARIIVLSEDLDKTIRILHGLNAIHIIELKEEVLEEELKGKLKKLETLREIISSLESSIKKPITIQVKEKIDATTVDELLEEYYNKLKVLNENISALRRKLEYLENTLKKLKELKTYIEVLALTKPNLKLNNLSYKGRTLQVQLVVIPKDKEVKLRKLLENENTLINILCSLQNNILAQIVYLSKVEGKVKKVLKDCDCITLDIPSLNITVSEYKKHIEEEIVKTSSQYNSVSSEIADLIGKHANDIAIAKVLLENVIEKVRVFKALISARYIKGIEGWIPVSIKSKLLNILDSQVGRYMISFSKPRSGEEPPTKTCNPKGIRNFEVLTKTYGVPKYNEWDPTPLLAYSFPVFFGLMLGDVVYGIILILTAKYILDRMVENPESESIRKLKNMLYISGITASIVGFFGGMFLGQTVNVTGNFGSILSPILSPYLELLLTSTPIVNSISSMLINPLNFIILALVIGLIHVNIALIVSLAKAIKLRNIGGILQNLGLLLIQVFGIPFILMSMFKYDIPILRGLESLLLSGIIVSLGVIIVSQLLIYRVLGVLTWVFTITGLLGDVLSYTRIAGVGM
ncbi:MAG TPA: hypothetical protein EYH40_05500, partial [Desulfurococcales archaeon]|nr:hypothetical protein [Desulfurococcales archaeon]